MKKISIKIGLLSFCLIFTMELCLFFLLHQKIAHSRIDEQLSALVTRGNNHRDVLETYYNNETIHHIALMEAKSDTEVVITDHQGKILISSSKVTGQIQSLLNQENLPVPNNGKVIEDNWKSGFYVATVSPYETGEHKGYVYMFQNTGQLKQLMQQLNKHFLIAGAATAFVTAVIILILSRIIARPLIKMKEATKKLSHGNFSIQLENKSNDELGELAESIQLLANDLKHLKTERNEFLASISHELRTPLTYIKGYAEVAKRERLSPEERLSYLTIITEESTKLTSLVTELMQLAQLDNHTFAIKKELFHIKSSLQIIAQKVKPAFQQEKQHLEIICPDHLQICGDPVRFEQMITNLLENARKYSAQGALTTVEAKQKDKQTVITITDEGKGIPTQYLPFVFDRLYRVDKSRSRELGGMGLGLSIVKELTDAHGWRIDIASEMGQGTTFTIITKEES